MTDIIIFNDRSASDAVAVSLEGFLGASNTTAVRIEPGEDIRELLPHLDRVALVEINFPVFGDGRGYSAAQILREHGFTGELRAIGDVLVDQLAYMLRCGFDSADPDQALDADAVQNALNRYPHVYQKTTGTAPISGRRPIWEIRHE
ncbi:DUF934 domain-containing protein [Sphingorhabdus sp. Alg239-R122]|uniref:DUF934 domain-containing protein n=1 Tax=Sphingorhabdus sp. Alg239-R122 TaxID=2305989 RepID=UPI0013DB12FB|nr:DUF934 domain-containing protein [Sphingorhabdus sp. Alg239-R122]